MTGSAPTADLLVVAPPHSAAGFRLAGTRTVIARDGEAARAAVEAEVAAGSEGVIAVSAVLWEQLPERVRSGWAARTVPLVVPLPDDEVDGDGQRGDRVRALLARSVGYEITFTPGGGGA